MGSEIDQGRSLERSIRLLGSFAGVILGGLGWVNWRISVPFLWFYHNLEHPVTWREPILGALSSPATFAASITLAIAAIIAAWRLSLPRAAWLNLWLALLNAGLFVAAVYFYFSLYIFIAETA